MQYLPWYGGGVSSGVGDTGESVTPEHLGTLLGQSHTFDVGLKTVPAGQWNT